jgi:hypothetical protein
MMFNVEHLILTWIVILCETKAINHDIVTVMKDLDDEWHVVSHFMISTFKSII